AATPRVEIQDPEARYILRARQERLEHLQRKTLTELPEHLDRCLAFYRSNLKKMIDASRARNVQLVFLTQPALLSKDMPPELEALLWMYSLGHGAGTPEYHARILDAYNQVMREVCREEKVDCIDLAALLPRDTTVFYDDCHFNLSGCDK